jgi:hypothetical protein
MSDFRFEQLSAFLDGSLDALTAAKITEALRSDAELVHQIEEMRRADALLREAVEAALVARPYGGVIPHALPRTIGPGWRKFALLAASLVVALAIGLSLPLIRPHRGGDGAALQSATLMRGLSVAHSGVPFATGEGALTVRLSFVAGSGSYCREYALVSGADETDGVACRTASGWRIEGQARRHGQQATGYGVAAGPDTMDAVVDRLRVQRVLDAEAEAAAIRSSWQRR